MEKYEGPKVGIAKGRDQITVGHMTPVVGMVTNGGTVTKINKKSFWVEMVIGATEFIEGYTSKRKITYETYGVPISFTNSKRYKESTIKWNSNFK